MCYQLIELYSACRCLCFQYAVERCASYGRPGHSIQRRTILVGYACSKHSANGSQQPRPWPSHHDKRQFEQDASEDSLEATSSSAETNAATTETKSLDSDQSQKPDGT